VYETSTVALIAFVSLIVGLAVGAWLINKLSPSQQNRKALEKHIQKLQRQQQDYQDEVNQHFSKTAELLNQMTESYRDVHNHLAKSASQLTSHGISPLQALPEDRPFIQGEPLAVAAEQPLDYAPRKPGGKGALDEDYGLEKAEREKREAEEKVAAPTGL
jgi:hypothetical protein